MVGCLVTLFVMVFGCFLAWGFGMACSHFGYHSSLAYDVCTVAGFAVAICTPALLLLRSNKPTPLDPGAIKENDERRLELIAAMDEAIAFLAEDAVLREPSQIPSDVLERIQTHLDGINVADPYADSMIQASFLLRKILPRIRGQVDHSEYAVFHGMLLKLRDALERKDVVPETLRSSILITMETDTDHEISKAIADAIEVNLALYYEGRVKETMFSYDAAVACPVLRTNMRTVNRSLRAAWGFAEGFFDSANEGFGDFDHKAWPVAEQLLKEIVACLRTGQEITDRRVLAYGDY